jgi:hypothetical protein
MALLGALCVGLRRYLDRSRVRGFTFPSGCVLTLTPSEALASRFPAFGVGIGDGRDNRLVPWATARA